MKTPLSVLACLALQLVLEASVSGQTAWYEGFEGPETSWRVAGGNAQHRIELHRRVQGEAHIGDGCERLRLTGLGGTEVYIEHAMGLASVIDELSPTVWIKSDRAGLQIVGRVVLPRARNPRTGQPVFVLVRGSSYTKVGRWQQLRIADVPQLLTRQIHMLRSQLGPEVDGREAYLDRVLLNIYGGPGITNVWVDDLDIGGYVAARPAPAIPVRNGDEVPATFSAADDRGWQAATAAPPIGGRTADPAGAAPDSPRVPELVRSVLLIEGRPMLPRVIRHRGEPLVFLKDLGFNAAWLPGLATPGLLAEAKQVGLWLICRPPTSTDPERAEGPADTVPEIGPEYGRVLAWDLSSPADDSDLERLKQWAQRVRRADRHRNRPLIRRTEAGLRATSRHVDILLIARAPLGSSLQLSDYGRWVRQRPLLARPGTPIWTTVQTQPQPELREQWRLLAQGRQVPTVVSVEQIRLLAYTAVAAGSRGLVFESATPLNADDPDTRARAAILTLLNLEIDVVEPWAAAGGYVAEVVAGNNEQVTAAVLRSDRARLLLPIWSAPSAQYVTGQSAGNRISFVVPGVPESHRAFEVIPGGLRPLRPERVTGGVQVTVEEFGLTGAVVFTQDELAISRTTRRARLIGPRAAELNRQLAAWKLHGVGQTYGQLRTEKVPISQSAAWLATAQQQLRRCESMLTGRDYIAAYRCAERAMRPLRLLERAHWRVSLGRIDTPVAAPAAVSFRTLPWHRGMMDRVASFGLGDNRLFGGDFEDLGTMLSTGWTHVQRHTEAVEGGAELIPSAAHTGRYGLRLSVAPLDPERSPELVEVSPSWIDTPAVPVQAGELIRIEGWINVPQAITGSVDGLVIVDSLGGEGLARRILDTKGWRRFTLYRVVPRDGRLSVGFRLAGLGEAWIDDVTIKPIQPIESLGITRLPSLDPLVR